MSSAPALASPSHGHVPVESVACPSCGGEAADVVARGPDYDCHSTGDQEFTLVQCRGCATYYLNPRPTLEALPWIYPAEEYYSYALEERASPVVLKARLARDRQKVRAIFAELGRPAAELRVLDIGAGDGALLEAFRASGVPPGQLHGVELDAGACERLRARGFHALQQRAEELAFPAGSFEVVTMIQVIEHVAEPRRLLETLHGMMQPGAILLLETPNMNSWDRPLFRGKTWGGYYFPRHWTLWDPASMRRLLEMSGYEPIATATLPAAVVWAWSISHLAEEWLGPGRVSRFFSMNNPLALGLFWLLELLPSRLGRSANMRVVARRK